MLLQIMLDGEIDALRLFRSHVADRAVDQPQTGGNGAFANLLDRFRVSDALYMLIGAELKIDAVRIGNGILRHIRADQCRQISADLTAQRQLAV